MILFWTLACALIALAVAFILLPLMRPLPQDPGIDQDRLNLEVFRQRLAELDADLSSGLLDQGQYDAARRDLERELLADLKGNQELTRPIRRPWALALMLAAIIPVFGVFAYLETGRPDLISGQTAGTEMLDELIARLEKRLEAEPKDLEGWLMLGRTYLAIDRPQSAVKAFERAYSLAPQSVAVLLAYAEALGLADPNKSLLGRPAELISEALALEPDNAEARWFSGLVAFQRGQYQSALSLWQGILDGLDPQSEEAANLRQMIGEARRRAGLPVASDDQAARTATDQAAGGGARLVIQVSLAPQLADRVSPEETVFVFARAAAGPPMPLAVQRLKVKDLPATVTLDDGQAMNPALKLSAFAEYRIGARVSRSGEATPQAGDLFGELGPVRLTDAMPIQLTIDQVRP